MTLVWGWVERKHGIASSHEQHFTVIRSSAVTPARDYDPEQYLDTRHFFLPGVTAGFVAKQVERKLPCVRSLKMNTSRNFFAI